MDKSTLIKMYRDQQHSMKEVAESLNCSVNKVDYWLRRHNIERRSRSDALYIKRNGATDPFVIKTERTPEEELLYGMGVGIYWGEGNKRNTHAVRMGNTDVNLVVTFVKFLQTVCGVQEGKIRYGLQLFTDVDENEALLYWQNALNITRNQIMPTVSRIKSGKIGTYKMKNQYGVMTVYVFNKKLRDWLVNQLVVPR